jgi:hypothetical protein
MATRLITLLCVTVISGCTLIEGILYFPVDPVGMGTGTHINVLPCCMYPDYLLDKEGYRLGW